MTLQITSGVVPKAQRVVVYGPEGIGKTTLAARWPDPVFIDLEEGADGYDVRRLPRPGSWTALLDEVRAVAAERPCATLVVDTADWAERLCLLELLAKNKWESIETPGYGKGYQVLAERYAGLLDALTEVRDAGMNVVLCCHAAMRKFEQPDEASPYDRWELKLQKKCAPLVKEWADAILFCNFKTIVETVGEGFSARGKARGAKRVIYAQHHACWDAKNRWGMPAESPMDWASVEPYISRCAPLPAAAPPVCPSGAQERAPEAPSAPEGTQGAEGARAPVSAASGAPQAAAGEGLPAAWAPAAQLMERDGVTFAQVRGVAALCGHYTADTPPEAFDPQYPAGFVVPNWEAVKAKVPAAEAAGLCIPF